MAACPPVRWLGVVRWLAVDRIAVADRVGTATYAPAMAVAAIPLMSATLPELAARGVVVPVYDRRPFVGRIVHIGVGGFHRSHMARYTHELLEETASAHDASSQWAITGLGLLPGDAAMAAALDAQDGLYTLIERGAGEPTVTVIGSIVGYHHAAGRRADQVLAAPGGDHLDDHHRGRICVAGDRRFDVRRRRQGTRPPPGDRRRHGHHPQR